jgi:hypothetical protein
MKRSIIVLGLLLFGITTYSQNFSYKKIVSNGFVLKTKGKIIISDTLINMTTKQDSSVFKVKKTLENRLIKQYRGKTVNSDNEIRITLNLKNNHFLLEIKDNFSNTNSSVLIFLKE